MGDLVTINAVNFAERVNRGVERLKSGPGAWGDTAEAAQDWICVVATTGILTGALIGDDTALAVTPTPEGGRLLRVEVDLDGASERTGYARALWAPLVAYEVLQREQGNVTADVGALPLLPILGAVTRITIALGKYALAGYSVNQAIQFVQNVFQRRQDSADLQRTQAAALEAVAQHAENEQKAGKQLPLNEPTKALLESLQKQSQTIAQKTYQQDAGILGSSKEATVPWYKSPWIVGIGGSVVGAIIVALAVRGARK